MTSIELGEIPFYGVRGSRLGHLDSGKGLKVDKAKIEAT